MESLEGWVDKLRSCGKLVLVEGKKDKNAMIRFGINNIVTVSQKPIYKIIDEVNSKDVVILTDLDREGRKYYHKLKHHLQKSGIKVDNKFREFLIKNKITHYIESIKI